MRPWLVAALALGLSLAATGDLAENLTGLKLQKDGDQVGDAGDDCAHAGPALLLGRETAGLLLPVDDESDYYTLPVGGAALNTTLVVTLLGNTDQLQAQLSMFTPGCARNFADLVHQHCRTGDHESDKGGAHENSHGHDGGSDCLVTDVRIGEHNVSFVPLEPATFVVLAHLQVTLGPGLPPLPVAADPALPGGPGAQACEPMCDTLNQLLGYHVGSGNG